MSPIVTLGFLALSATLAFAFSLSPWTYFTAQLVAFITIVLIIFFAVSRRRSFGAKKPLFYSLLSLTICLLVFTTNGLNSPFFFLIYFLLFATALQHPPSVTLAFSLFLIFFLSNSLDSANSLLELGSLLFITPLVWFIGRQYLENNLLNTSLSQSETDIFFWLTLKFKTGIVVIIDAASQLLSQPLTPSQHDLAKKIRDSGKSLLNSSQNLKTDLDHRTDENNDQ
ncbi:MAG: hypothetical protein WC686_01970 [Candidatus Shapirobacteria bacterium]|jgi:hypothetical protein